MLFAKDLKKAILVLADGSVFEGYSLGKEGLVSGELVFNTSMSGYQEIITDPSYAHQIITFTQAHVGNTGCNDEDYESLKIYASGIVMRNCTMLPSNHRSNVSLPEWLLQNDIVAITAVDTRALTLHLRDKGAIGACITTNINEKNEALAKAKEFTIPKDIVKDVSVKSVMSWPQDKNNATSNINNKFTPNIVVYDYGVKHSILNILNATECNIILVPFGTTFEEVLSLNPHGILFSNGPGDPKDCDFAITTIKKFLDHKIPVFGICLGFQLLSLALGAKSLKMKFGHHGANHPVIEVNGTKRIFITSQNHGFAIDENTLPDVCEVTHRSLFDHSLQGIKHRALPVYGFQGHPEAGPGPHDIEIIFNPFIDACRNRAASVL